MTVEQHLPGDTRTEQSCENIPLVMSNTNYINTLFPYQTIRLFRQVIIANLKITKLYIRI